MQKQVIPFGASHLRIPENHNMRMINICFAFLCGCALLFSGCDQSSNNQGNEHAWRITADANNIWGWSSRRVFTFDKSTCSYLSVEKKQVARQTFAERAWLEFDTFVNGRDKQKILNSIGMANVSWISDVKIVSDSAIVQGRNGPIHVLYRRDSRIDNLVLPEDYGRSWVFASSTFLVACFTELTFDNSPYEMPPSKGIHAHRAGWDPCRPKHIRPLVSHGKGLFLLRLGEQKWRSVDLNNGISSDDVTCIDVSDSRVLVGHFNGAVDIYDFKKDKTSLLLNNNDTGGPVTSVCWGKEFAFVGTEEKGLIVCRMKKNAWQKCTAAEVTTRGRVNVLFYDNGNVWIGTDEYFACLDSQTLETKVLKAFQ